jgi:hypothetical protein
VVAQVGPESGFRHERLEFVIKIVMYTECGCRPAAARYIATSETFLITC